MNKKHSIVLILGNGFDLNLGRPTSYKDFWETNFCPKEYPAPLIKHLNNTWRDNLAAVKWYDLENEFFKYFKSTMKPEYEDVVSEKEKKFLSMWNCCNIRSSINDYPLFSEEIISLIDKNIIEFDKFGQIYMSAADRDELIIDRITRDRKALEYIKQGLCNYLKSINTDILKNHSAALSTLYTINQAREKGNVVNVYNFNYTELPPKYENDLNPQYIHGRCKNNNIIIGTKDSKEFNSDYDFLQKSFDSDYETPPVVSDLLKADEVVIFGHSLGMNDNQYFKPFFNQQTDIHNFKRKRITIFTKNRNSKLEIKRSLQEMTDFNLSLLNSMNDIDIIETDNISTDRRTCKTFKAFIERFVSDKELIHSLSNVD